MKGYRKLLGLLVVAICATVLQALGSFSESVAIFLGSVYAAFVTGNAIEARTFGSQIVNGAFSALTDMTARAKARPAPPKGPTTDFDATADTSIETAPEPDEAFKLRAEVASLRRRIVELNRAQGGKS